MAFVTWAEGFMSESTLSEGFLSGEVKQFWLTVAQGLHFLENTYRRVSRVS